jgi:thioredoxin 1
MRKIIKYSAVWCSPCKAFAPKFEKISKMEEFKDVEFLSLDIEDDESQESVEKYQIRNVPSVVITDNDGNISKKIIGNIPENDLINLIKEELAK